MPNQVYCQNRDCIHKDGCACTFNERAGIIVLDSCYDHGCDEYRKKECDHTFKCSKCGEEVQK